MRKYANTEKSEDNIETVAGLKEALTEWMESLEMPWTDGIDNTEELEWQSRSGFHAHNHNRGGMDRISIVSLYQLIGSGDHYNTAIKDKVEKDHESNHKNVAESHPTLDPESEEFRDIVDEYSQDDYDAYAFRVRAMYEGEGVVCIHAGYDLDAPYFRWNSKAEFTHEIKFKTIAGLKRQLKSLTKKIESV